MTYDADCAFCRIANSRSEDVELVKEGRATVAFWDISPQAPEHLLVVPRQHLASFSELTFIGPYSRAEIMSEVVSSASSALSSSDYRLVVNVGPSAGQTIGHLHFHILGGRHFQWPPG